MSSSKSPCQYICTYSRRTPQEATYPRLLTINVYSSGFADRFLQLPVRKSKLKSPRAARNKIANVDQCNANAIIRHRVQCNAQKRSGVLCTRSSISKGILNHLGFPAEVQTGRGEAGTFTMGQTRCKIHRSGVNIHCPV
jgi:hypothetical protein